MFSVLTYFKECSFSPDCSFTNLSCRYLSHLNSSIIQEFYPDTDSAIQAVESGNAWGALYFTENFTDALVARIALGSLFCIDSYKSFVNSLCDLIIF